MYRALVPGAIGVKVSFEEGLRLAKTHGFQGVGISPADVQQFGVDGVVRLLQQYQLVPAMAGMPVNFRRDETTFEEGLAGLPAFAAQMATIGCPRIITSISPWHETLAYRDNFQQLRARTARICEVLARYGLRYGLEYVGPATSRAGEPNPFIHDLAGMLELIRSVGAHNLGLLLDAWHWYTAGETAADLLQLSDWLVVAVHVNDAPSGIARDAQVDHVRTLPGETGVIDIAAFLQALAQLHYTGPLIVEPFSARLRELPPEEAVAATARSLDRMWEITGLP